MIFERFEEKGLSHFSYAIGCKEKEQIAIIDPRRDVEIYLRFAEKHHLTISHVFTTHIHGDIASGARELSKRARALLCLSGYDKGEKYAVTFSHKECREGDRFCLGSVELKVLHTPGHTPEHISLCAYRNQQPKALFTGDFLQIGTIGFPEVDEKEECLKLATAYYHSLKIKLKDLPNELDIFPAHGSGMAINQSSTLGHERLVNPFLHPGLSEKEFIETVLRHHHQLPPYFNRLKTYNTNDQRFEIPIPAPFELMQFKHEMDRGATIIDLRDQKAFASGHIPGSLCIGAGSKVGFWASWAVPYNVPILLVANDPLPINETVQSLARMGFDKIIGFLKGGFETWRHSSLPVDTLKEYEPYEIHEIESPPLVIDVRSQTEWDFGHIENAIHIPCQNLPLRLTELPNQKVAFVCAGGYRSIFAASLARRVGWDLVGYISGGMHAYQLGLSV